MLGGPLLADADRLRPIEDANDWFPALGFAGADTLQLGGEAVLVTDPIFLADVYNPNDDPVAAYVRAQGVVVADFGGDSSCSVWWRDPVLLLPLSGRSPRDPSQVAGAVRVAEEVGCDSGSFVFLPIRAESPAPVRAVIDQVLAARNSAAVQVPAGRYRVSDEQHDPPAGWPASFGRDIVVWRQG